MRQPLAAVLILAGTLLPAHAAHGQSPLSQVSPETTVNTFTAGDQTSPAVAASASGVVWMAWFDLGSAPSGIKARRYRPDGAPLSPEILVRPNLSFSSPAADGPRIGAAADGGCVVVWAESTGIWLRRFGPDGASLDGPRQIVASARFGSTGFPDVAVASDGSFVVAWVEFGVDLGTLLAQRFNPQGQSLGTPLTVIAGFILAPRLANTADGGFLAVWADRGAIFARGYLGASGTPSAIQQVSAAGTDIASKPALALTSDGKARVAWITRDGVWVRRLGVTGEPSGPAVKVGEPEVFGISSPAVALAKDGKALVVWSGPGMMLQGRLLNGDLTPFSGVFPAADPAFVGTDPVLAAASSGDVVLAWSSGFAFHFPVTNPPPIAGRDGDGQGIAFRTIGPLRCAAGSDVLCLGSNHRFEARVAWTNPNNGDTGAGHSLPLTGDTGAFWFFGDQNLELMLKVLDGTSVNLRYWLYSGALSNVEYTLTVTDTLTGVERTYHNPAGQFASFADVTAFPFGVSAEAAETAAAGVEPLRAVACGDLGGLCLAAGQFLVTVSFTDPRTGLAGAATAVPLTGDTGAFWFFGDTNLELMIKVLDGRTVNGKFWVFYGALSDVDYTITVTRLETGAVKTYHNPRGTLASRADVQAF